MDMRVSRRADWLPLSRPWRWLVFGGVVALGATSGNIINIEPLGWTYGSLLQLVADPGIQIASLTTGVAMGFVLGFIHLTSI